MAFPNTQERHERVCRMLGDALTLGEEAGWLAFSANVAVRLEDEEKAALGYSVLRAQTPEHAEMTADAAINGPVPQSFLDTPAGRQVLIDWREERDRRQRT